MCVFYRHIKIQLLEFQIVCIIFYYVSIIDFGFEIDEIQCTKQTLLTLMLMLCIMIAAIAHSLPLHDASILRKQGIKAFIA